MTLVDIVVVLLIVGVLLWLVKAVPFIDGDIKQIITWLVIVVVVLWLLSVLLGVQIPGLARLRLR